MYEYLKSLNKDSLEFATEAAFEEFYLEKRAIENDYEMSIRLFDLTNKPLMESEEGLPEAKRDKFKNKVSSIFKSLCGAAGKALDNVSKKLTGETSNVDDYLSSRAGEIRMEQDIKKIQEEVKKAAREADQLVQSIAKGTNMSDEAIDNFITKTKRIFDSNTDATITAAGAAGVYAAQISIYDDMKKKAGEDGVFQQCKTMEGQDQITRIINAVANMYQKESRIFTVFMSKFDALSKKDK